MVDIVHGHCGLVRLEFAGDETTALVAAGGTDIPIGDASDFNDAGGLLTFTKAETGSTTVAYTILDDGDESGTPVLRLATPLAADLESGSLVYVWNPSPAGLIVEWVASVVDDTDGGAIEATVPHALIEKLGENVTALLGRSVTAQRIGGVWYIADVLGSQPIISDATWVGGTITGPLIRTAASGMRWEMSADFAASIRAYTGLIDETSPGQVGFGVNGYGPIMQMFPPKVSGTPDPGFFEFFNQADGAGALIYTPKFIVKGGAGLASGLEFTPEPGVLTIDDVEVVLDNDHRLSGPDLAPFSSRTAGTQSVSNNLFTSVTFGTVVTERSVSVSGATFTVDVPGLYDIGTSVAFATNTTGSRHIRFLRNGSEIARGSMPVSAAVPGRLQLNRKVELEVGDTIVVQVYQNSGASLDIVTTNGPNHFDMTWLGWGGLAP